MGHNIDQLVNYKGKCLEINMAAKELTASQRLKNEQVISIYASGFTNHVDFNGHDIQF